MAGVFAHPVWFDAAGAAYDHETGYMHEGAAMPYAVSGPIQLGNGDQVATVLSLVPDEATQESDAIAFASLSHDLAPRT